MARSIRIEYSGAFYHVMARGNRRELIFFDDEDRRFFLETLGRACARTGWRVHGWVLMSNHYHLAIETPEPNLVVGMQWLQNTFTRRFNVRHRKWGRVFGDRYKAIVIEGGSGYYYESLLDYIHLNPVRVGLVRTQKGESVLDFAWSSVAGGCALPGRQRPPWLAAEAVLRAFGCEDTAAGRRRFVERLDRRAVEEGAARAGVPLVEAEADARCSHLRRGWGPGADKLSRSGCWRWGSRQCGGKKGEPIALRARVARLRKRRRRNGSRRGSRRRSLAPQNWRSSKGAIREK